MKRKASKKYPVFTYAFYLILVGILVTGVTFSRYSITQSGDVSTGVAAFDCSYTIEDFSSLNFNNSDYWLTAGNDGSGGMIAAGTAHTVRVTMKNSNNGKTSGTDVQAHLRVYMSSQLADNLAIQISTENTAGTQNTYTPQIPLGELFYGTTGGTNDNGTPVLYDKYKDYGNDDTVDTAKVDTADFHNYGDRSEAEDETLTVLGTLKNSVEDSGTLVVSGQKSGLQMTVTAQQRTVNYAVGFSRGVRSTPVYLDLQRDETYYTFDITLPSMLYEGEKENGSTHVVYFTLTDEIDNTAYWYNTEPKQDAKGRWYITTDTQTTQNVVPVYDANDNLVIDMDTLIESPSQGYYFDDGKGKVKITGYHFEQEATATYTDENKNEVQISTTVRVKCEYAKGGEYNVSLYHVAPLSETSAAHYVHPIKWGDDVVLMKDVGYSAGSMPFKNISTGTCINSAGGMKIDISQITIDPIDKAAPITVAVNRSYYFDITALFVQASETP